MPNSEAPEEYQQNDSVYRTLNQNGDDGLLAAGFSCSVYPETMGENQPGNRYTGYLLLHGSGCYTDSSNNDYALTPGSFYHHFPGKSYTLSIEPENDWAVCYLAFGSPLCQGLLAAGLLSPDIPVMQPGLNNELISSFLQLVQGLQEAADSELPQFIPSMLNILVHICQLDRINRTNPAYTELVTFVAAALSINLDEKIEIKDLLKDQPLSYDRFRFIFKQEIGVSPGIYRINKKMEKARELLTSGKFKVYQVAEMLGYPDAYSFSKQFSRFVGISPKDYISSV